MKKTIKGFVLGLIVATMLMGTVFGVGVREMIEVAFNSINLTVNEKKVEADNILYKGTTYVPLRAIGEMLGKDVGWNGDTNTASINDKKTKTPVVEKETPKKDDGLITVDKVPYEITILEPNSIGTVYMEATYKNNTKYPITSINMKVLRKDENKIGYLMNHDTVMPGETSPIFDGFGPSTMRDEDYEILNITVRAESDDGETMVMEYDVKLDKYEYMKY